MCHKDKRGIDSLAVKLVGEKELSLGGVGLDNVDLTAFRELVMMSEVANEFILGFSDEISHVFVRAHVEEAEECGDNADRDCGGKGGALHGKLGDGQKDDDEDYSRRPGDPVEFEKI